MLRGAGSSLVLTGGDLAAPADSTEGLLSPETLRTFEEAREPRVRAVSDAVKAEAERFYEPGAGRANSGLGSRALSAEAMRAHPIDYPPLPDCSGSAFVARRRLVESMRAA